MAGRDDFDALIAEAEAHVFEGWDFSFLEGRDEVDPTPWDYQARVEELARGAESMADLGTGGGEFVASLAVRAPLTIATEGWMPNVPVADRNLRPLGAHVVAVEGAPDNAQQRFTDLEGRLPFRDASLDLIFDRHEAHPGRRGGPGVAPRRDVLNSTGREPQRDRAERHTRRRREAVLEPHAGRVRRATRAGRARSPRGTRSLPCQALLRCRSCGGLPAGDPVAIRRVQFDTRTHVEALRAIHEIIAEDGAFTAHMHRLLLEAKKPGEGHAV